MIVSIELVSQIAFRCAVVKVKPSASSVSFPGHPSTWNAVPRSLTRNVVPSALLLVTNAPVTFGVRQIKNSGHQQSAGGRRSRIVGGRQTRLFLEWRAEDESGDLLIHLTKYASGAWARDLRL
jgi:hypothetical protein